MRSKILKNKKEQLLKDTKKLTAREAREESIESKFKDRYKPSRKQLFAFNESISRMARASNQSREAIYYLIRDSFCFTHEVVVPTTYAGFRHVLKSHNLR